jgi:hypothetical protein
MKRRNSRVSSQGSATDFQGSRGREAGLELSELGLQGTDLPLAPLIPFEMRLPILLGERYGTDPTALAHAERSSV